MSFTVTWIINDGKTSVNTQCLDHWVFRTCLSKKTQKMYRYVINEMKNQHSVSDGTCCSFFWCCGDGGEHRSTSQVCSDGFKSGDAGRFIYETAAIVVSSLIFRFILLCFLLFLPTNLFHITFVVMSQRERLRFDWWWLNIDIMDAGL